MKILSLLALLPVLLLGIPAACSANDSTETLTLLNVSYDPTRELYEQVNVAFAQDYKSKTGRTVTIQQSHGGSGKQAGKVIDGLEADVVTLALAYDIDAIAAKSQLLPADWQKKLPDNSTPYTSTIVFVVKKGNPKAIHDWADLIRGDTKIIVANPKTSGGARWAYLAAYGQQLRKSDETQAQQYIKAFYQHAPVLGSGARESTLQFAQQELGDVLVSWENEAYLTLREFGADKFEIVTPPVSILAEPPVAVVEANARKHGTETLAHDYLTFLYTPAAQEIIGKNYYRPTDPAIAAKYAGQFPPVDRFTITQIIPGGWPEAQKAHFADHGLFDRLSK